VELFFESTKWGALDNFQRAHHANRLLTERGHRDFKKKKEKDLPRNANAAVDLREAMVLEKGNCKCLLGETARFAG
jgi:hypothetical protein